MADEPQYERPVVQGVAEHSLFAGAAPLLGWGGSSAEDDPQPSHYRIPICYLREDEERYVVEIELPGVAPEEIDLEVGQFDVVVSAQAAEAEDGEMILPFYGSLALAEEVDPDGSTTAYENGMLELALPKVERRSRKRFQFGDRSDDSDDENGD
jgi:HSP20 family molecular chaperone IbpA